ncbi:uncharacterized protein C4orf17 homolog [Ambystoma mexicanum]|uniref:uncharacterized protein C4orf17 homolog n=1 Tax=Ambystoma mexicanum TaxID=8296 RepID=UPI0037E931C4
MSISCISGARKGAGMQYKPALQPPLYYAQPRHIPHSKVVRHINGLNNAPICSVQDAGIYSGKPYDLSKLSPAERDLLLRYLQPPCRGRGLDGNLYPLHTMAGLPKLKDRGRGLLRPNSKQAFSKHEQGQFSDRTRHVDKAEEDSPKKSAPPSRAMSRTSMQSRNKLLRNPSQNEGVLAIKCQEEPLRRTTPSTPGASPSRAQNSLPVHGLVDRSHPEGSQHLDREISVLAKLCQILQTDSLADVQHWLQTASIQEKEQVADMIHSILDMEYANQQDERNYAMESKHPQSNMYDMRTSEADAAERAPRTRPASRIIEAKMSSKQENDKEARQHVPLWRHTTPAPDTSRHATPLSRPRTQEQSRKPVAGTGGTVHLRYTKSAMPVAKPCSKDEPTQTK